jgi:hypothetical protein
LIRNWRVGAITLLIGLSLASSGCVAVKPWERDLLARPDMAGDEDVRLATMKTHIRFSKEGSLPAGGGAGGGCGCN